MENIESYTSLYVLGKTCTGKTTKILEFMKKYNYEYNYLSLNQIKTEAVFKSLLYNNNICNIMKKTKNQKFLIIDNIDHLQNTEKKLISSIMKQLKHIKKKSINSNLKFIFIGTNCHDKKVIELIDIVDKVIKMNDQINETDSHKNVKETVKILLTKKNTDPTKIIDKTIVALIYHENMINYQNLQKKDYEKFLKSFSIGDYFDRISFQKQLWQFNEMTFYLKVINPFYYFQKLQMEHNGSDIIFTKILTKYSNEYSNMNFVINNCNKLNYQKYELIDKLKKNSCLTALTNVEVKRLQKILL